MPYVGFLANALGQTDRGGITTALALALIAFGIITTARGAIAKRDAAGASTTTEAEQSEAVHS